MMFVRNDILIRSTRDKRVFLYGIFRRTNLYDTRMNFIKEL